jgi:hypothetical protein
MPEDTDLELEDEVIEDEVVDTPEEEVIVDEPEEQDVILLEGEELPKEEERDPNNTENAVIRSFRAREKELKRKLQEAQALANQVQTQPKVEDIGPKPTKADDGIDYDEDKYDKALLAWYEKKKKVDEVQNKVKAEHEAQQKAWNDKVQSYEKAKKTLRVRDFDDAEESVKELFTPAQLSIILDGAKKPEELIYAIGKRPELANKLSGEKNLARFTMEIGVLETKIRSTRKDAPAPERVVRSGGTAVSLGNSLEKLRDEASKTGNWDKYFAVKRAREGKK